MVTLTENHAQRDGEVREKCQCVCEIKTENVNVDGDKAVNRPRGTVTAAITANGSRYSWTDAVRSDSRFFISYHEHHNVVKSTEVLMFINTTETAETQ